MNSLIFLSLAGFFYALHELITQGKSMFEHNMTGFWQLRSWNRKYKWDAFGNLIKAPNNWYYRLIGVKYKERWPTSTWLTVAFTDAPHMLQWFYIKLFIASAITYREVYSWYWDGLILLGAWYLVFNLTYQTFQKHGK